MRRTGEWLLEAAAQRVPVLGVCFGHQLLAETLGVPLQAVTLVAGHGARDKLVEIAAPAERVRRLGAEKKGSG